MTSALRLVIPLILIVCAQSFFPFTRSAEKEPELDANSIRGVPPYKLSQYESDVLVCDNGQKTYTKNMLNDGYCDCVDGSDEPGTSGCNGNVFYCLNKGYRIIEIPSSRVDDGVCDCCDGSDENVVTKCGNVCAAAHAKEKQMMEKMAAAYKAGSVIRANDIERIEKSRDALSKTVEPLKAKVEEMRKVLESLKDIKKKGEELNAELKESAHIDVRIAAGKLLELSDIPNAQMAGLMSSLFDVLDMNDGDVRHAVVAAGVKVIEPKSADPFNYDDVFSTPKSESVEDKNEGVDDDMHYAESGEYSVDDMHDLDEKEKEMEVADEGEVLEGGTDTDPDAAVDGAERVDEPPYCSLQQHVNDPRLRFLCNHKPPKKATADDTLSYQTAAAAIAHDNAKTVLLHLLKTQELYPEMQILFGHQRIVGTFEGAADFYKEHKKNSDTKTCPASWGGGDDVCSLHSKLSGLYGTLNTLPGKSPDADMDLSAKEKELQEKEAELEDAERTMLEYEDYSDYSEYLALKDKCFAGKEGKFTYNVCILNKLTQADSENSHSDDVLLGTFSSIESNNNTGGIIMHFTQGAHCWAFGSRKADVFISCGPVQKMISSNEPTTCYYTFEVESPSACTEKFAQINGVF